MALTDKLTAIGDAIREKTGKSALLSLDEMPVEIRAIEGGDIIEVDSHEWEDKYLTGGFVNSAFKMWGTYENDRITKVRSYAFSGTMFDKIILPNVEELEPNAFYDLLHYTFGNTITVELPKITKISYNAFQKENASCGYNLIVNAPLVTEIGSYSFSGQNYTITIDFPLVEKINDYTFSNCSRLENVNLPNLTSMGNYCFQYCVFTTFNHSKLETIGNHCFAYCNYLEEVKLPNLISAGYGIFYNCGVLKKVDFGELFTSFTTPIISSYSHFYNCSKLEALILRSKTLVLNPSSNIIYSNCGIAKGTGYIYVPAALVEEYKVAANWSVYADQIRAIEDYPEICGEVAE